MPDGINSAFKEYILNHHFKYYGSSKTYCVPLVFSLVTKNDDNKLNILKYVEIMKHDNNYILTYSIYRVKTYQFTFDIYFEIKPNQKSKYLKLEPEILSIFEKHLLLRSY